MTALLPAAYGGHAMVVCYTGLGQYGPCTAAAVANACLGHPVFEVWLRRDCFND